jgi:hypothetical protein
MIDHLPSPKIMLFLRTSSFSTPRDLALIENRLRAKCTQLSLDTASRPDVKYFTGWLKAGVVPAADIHAALGQLYRRIFLLFCTARDGHHPKKVYISHEPHASPEKSAV